jgi:ABC-type uncharacterized transport system auxiliary subunit
MAPVTMQPLLIPGIPITKRQAMIGSALACLALTGGCISLLPDPGKPQPVLAFEVAGGLPGVRDPIPAAVGINLPGLDPFLSGTRVVVRDEDDTLAYLHGVRLAAPVGVGLQNLMIQTIDQTRAARSAIRANTTARPELEVFWDIRRFEVTLPGRGGADGVATMAGTVRLVRTLDGRVLASRVITTTAPARRGDPGEAVAGLEAAARAFCLEAVTWMAGEGRAGMQQPSVLPLPPDTGSR